MSTLSRVLEVLKKPEILFLCIALPFCLAFAITIPAGAGYDENFHVCRIIELSHGNLFTDPIAASPDNPNAQEWGGAIDKNLYETIDENWKEFHLGSHEDYSFPIWNDERITSDRPLGEEAEVYAYGSAALYSPIVYLPYILGYLIGGLFFHSAYPLVIFMRIAGILFYCAAMFLCIRKIDFGRWTLCCIALFPNALCTFSTITADPLSFIGVVSTLVVFIKLCKRDTPITKKELIALSIVCLIVCFSKVAYLPVLLLFFVLPIWNHAFRKKENLIPVISVVIICGILFLCWYFKANSAAVNAAAAASNALDPSAQAAYIRGNLAAYIGLLGKTLFAQTIFDIKSTGVAAEYSTTGGWLGILALCLACFARDKRDTPPLSLKRRSAIFIGICFVIFVLICILIYTALYLQFTTVGANAIGGVQARYFIPLLPLILMPISLLSYRYLAVKQHNETEGVVVTRYLAILLCLNALTTIWLIYMGIYIGS